MGIRRALGVFVEAGGTTLNANFKKAAQIIDQEFKKILIKSKKFEDTVTTKTAPGFESATNLSEMHANFANFKQAAINFIFYVINEDSQSLSTALTEKKYTYITGKVDYFYGSNSPPNVGEWVADEQYPPFASGKNALNSIIGALKDIEKIMSRVDKPKTMFGSKPLSFEDAKSEVLQIINTLFEENGPLAKYDSGLFKYLQEVKALLEEQTLDQMARDYASSVSSGRSSVVEDEEETAGNTLPGTATSASAASARHEVEEGGTLRPRSGRHRNTQ